MLKTTSKVPVIGAPAGVQVVPDELWIPVVVTSSGKSPTLAASALAALVASIEERVRGTGAQVEFRDYESWTEKLAGKSIRGVGARQHAKTTVLVKLDLGQTGFVERVQMLEAIRDSLAPLDDGTSIGVGAPKWRVSDKERYRGVVTQQCLAHVRASMEAFGVDVHEIRGGHGLSVHAVGPMSAYVQLDIDVALRGLQRAPSSIDSR